MTDFADVADYYGIPARDPGQVRPTLRAGPTWKMLYQRLRRRAGARRLAYLDSTFPWERSGFRYHEALAILELRPDTKFFSMWELTDPFPVTVHPLADFPVIAPAAGITDAYAVFQLFLAGLCGLRPSGSSPPHPMEGLDLSRVLSRTGIRLHGSIYPGGGFTNTAEGLAQTRELSGHLATTFSSVPAVLEAIPTATPEVGMWTETRFYEQTHARWERPRPLVCLFAADGAPRKGLDAVVAAFSTLDPREFHLHVVGPHEHRRSALPADIATFHGWCSPAQLRELHTRVHVFVSPVSIEAAGPPGSLSGVIDGFPTQAARDAMSSGCLLVSANPARDHRALTPGTHYVDCAPNPDDLRATLISLSNTPGRTQRLARAGSDRVRQRFDVRSGAAIKLRRMGLLDGAPSGSS